MKHALILGAGKSGQAFLRLLSKSKHLSIAGVLEEDKELLLKAERFHVPLYSKVEELSFRDIDIMIDTKGKEELFRKIAAEVPEHILLVPEPIAKTVYELINDKDYLNDQIQSQVDHQKLIMDHIHDGMIVVDETAAVKFINRSAERILDKKLDDYLHKPVSELVPDSRLPHVLKTRRKEVNQRVTLENKKRVISTRIPIIDQSGNLQGAFAVFKDITEVLHLAEEITNLNEVSSMLEAVIQSSEEAISVVDKDGNGLMINPAYTRLTGLEEKDIVGKPATVDISEGESVHFQVLQTRRPIRGTRMKVGKDRKEVLVNVAPVLVGGTIKGSVGVLHDLSEISKLNVELQQARKIIRSLEATYTFADIIGSSEEMRVALEQAKVGAKTPATVLLRGASGTGKELFAHAIHNESDRKYNKFIRVNCAAIAESLLESELFGYEKGAFTGANEKGKKGIFEEANNGSIFLDEISELSANMQAKLLRVLQENEIVRVGGTKATPINVRIITATNRNLEKAIMDTTFREDLYYRLNRLPIYIPSVKERITDIPELVHHIITKLNQDYSRNIKGMTDEAIRLLKTYSWPGNVREMENVIGRAMIFMDLQAEYIDVNHLPALQKEEQDGNSLPNHPDDSTSVTTLKKELEQYEATVIKRALAQHNGNKTETAKRLQISLRSLYYKLEKYQLE